MSYESSIHGKPNHTICRTKGYLPRIPVSFEGCDDVRRTASAYPGLQAGGERTPQVTIHDRWRERASHRNELPGAGRTRGRFRRDRVATGRSTAGE